MNDKNDAPEDRVDSLEVTRAITGAELDVQIVTARQFPRSLKAFSDELGEMVTLDRETADECFYTLKRWAKGGVKLIIGPSIRFAELCSSAWGNMRVASRIVVVEARRTKSEGEKWGTVTVESMAMDLQKNVAWKTEVRRTIQVAPDKGGVDITVQAAQSIAARNAVLKVVPQGLWTKHYKRAMSVAIGDGLDMETRRANAVSAMEDLKIPLPRALFMLGKSGVEELTPEALLVLRAACRQIKDGAASVDDLFPPTDSEKKQSAVTTAAKAAGAVVKTVTEAVADLVSESAGTMEEAPADKEPMVAVTNSETAELYDDGSSGPELTDAEKDLDKQLDAEEGADAKV